jgi:hypothetical protein
MNTPSLNTCPPPLKIWHRGFPDCRSNEQMLPEIYALHAGDASCVRRHAAGSMHSPELRTARTIRNGKAFRK